MKLSRNQTLFNIAKSMPPWVKDIVFQAYIKKQRREMKSRRYPNKIKLFVTEKCNMNCKCCFLPDKPRPDMTTAQILKLAASLKGVITNYLGITGGEPFLRKDLRTITQAFINAGVKRIHVVTTGWHTTDIIAYAMQFKDKVELSFQFSFDGPRHIHDKKRIPGALDNMLFTTIGLRAAGFTGDITLLTMISEENLDYLPEMIQMVNKSECYHDFNFDRTLPQLPPYFERAVKTINQLYYSKQTALFRKMGGKKFDYQKKWWESGSHNLECFAGKSDCIIWADGSISRCEILPPINDVYGRTLKDCNYNFKEFWDRASWIGGVPHKCSCNHDCNIQNSMLFDIDFLRGILK